MMDYNATIQFARDQDGNDPLRHFRGQFIFPKTRDGSDAVYLVGHSLGLQPQATQSDVEFQLQRWGSLGVNGHFKGTPGWMDFGKEVDRISAMLVGAQEDEVTVLNTLSVNLHLLLSTFYRPTEERYKILLESDAFPSDRYVVMSQLEWHGIDAEEGVIEVGTVDGRIDESELLESIRRHGQDIAVVFLGGVNYLSGQRLDMTAITKCGHQMGCLVGFDLAHAVGNVVIDVRESEFDFAAWCNYKYLNAGPGALGSIFVNRKHAEKLPALRGWWGHDPATRFAMDGNYEPAPGVQRWHLSTPPLLSLIPIRTSLSIVEQAGTERMRDKSEALSGYLVWLLDRLNDPRIEILTPRDARARGAQISLRIEGATKEINHDLSRNGVMVDWREPGVIRAAPSPLYNSFEDIWRFVEILQKCLA